jgi:hypothetical protein
MQPYLGYYLNRDGEAELVSDTFSISRKELSLYYGGGLTVVLVRDHLQNQQLKKQVLDLKARLQALEQRVKALEQGEHKVQVQARPEPRFPAHRKLDIGILYADPLVVKPFREHEDAETLEPLSYKEEINRLRACFSKYAVGLEVTVGTNTKLVDIIKKQPRILHMICHGVEEVGNYSLCLESQENIGKIY